MKIVYIISSYALIMETVETMKIPRNAGVNCFTNLG